MRSRKAFTIIELFVVMGIFIILSIVVLSDYRNYGRAQRLSAAADEMGSRIKQAQGLAYSNAKQSVCTTDNSLCGGSSLCDTSPGPSNPCADAYIARYGAAFDIDGTKTKYMIGADRADYGNYIVGEAVPGGIVKLPSGITIESVTPAPAVGAYAISYIYDSTNASPFVTCSSNCLTSIVLKETTSNSTKTVTVEKRTGLVNIQ